MSVGRRAVAVRAVGAGTTAEQRARVQEHVRVLAAAPRNGRHHPEHLAAAQDYTAAHLAEAGWAVSWQPVSVCRGIGVTDSKGPKPTWPLAYYRRLKGVNVLARREGPGGGGALLVLAHIDSVKDSPGADDNASGVAALLEVATLLQGEDLPGPVVLAAVDLEETGHQGSRELARSTRGEIGAVVCLESVGCFDPRPGSQQLPVGARWAARGVAEQVARRDHRGDFALLVHREASTVLARRWAAHAHDAGLDSVALRDPRRTGWRGRAMTFAMPPLSNLDRSDHEPFWRAGVPALLVTDTAPLRNPAYHLPGDIAGTVSAAGVAAVAAATAALAAQGWT